MYCFDFEKYIENCGNRIVKGYFSIDVDKKN